MGREATWDIEALSASVRASMNSSYSDMTRSYKVLSHAVPILVRYYRALQELGRVRSEAADEEEYRRKRDALLDTKHEETSRLVARMYDELGGVYLKAAQYAVSQGSLLPRAWERELRFAFDKARSRPWEEIERVLTGDVGSATLDELLENVSKEPLAAASVGQVHRGRLARPRQARTGEGAFADVAIKVVFEDARRNMCQDLKNHRSLCLQVDALLGLGMRQTIEVILDEFDNNFPCELDLTLELRNMRRAVAIFENRGFGGAVVVPQPVVELCGSSSLTAQFLEGTTLASFDAHCRRELVVKRRLVAVIDAIGASLFLDGFFHADAHPGNVLVLDDRDALALIDWGQCCELDLEQRAHLARLVLLLNARSPDLVAAALDDPLGTGLADRYEFAATAADLETRRALLYQFFDSTAQDCEIPEAIFRRIEDALSHDPASLPIFSKVPSEVIFFARTVGALRRCLAVLGETTFSIAALWAKYARQTLQEYHRVSSSTYSPRAAADAALLSLPLNYRWTRRVERAFPRAIRRLARAILRDPPRLRKLVLGAPDDLEAKLARFLRSDLLHLSLLPRLDALFSPRGWRPLLVVSAALALWRWCWATGAPADSAPPGAGAGAGRDMRRMGILHLLSWWCTITSALVAPEISVPRCGVSRDGRFVSDSWLRGIVWSAEIKGVVRDVRSEFQHITVVDTVSLGRALILDGALQCAERDEAGYHEFLAHVPLLRRGAPRRELRVLIVGGGDGGVAREILRHPEVEHVTLVDIDRGVVDAARDLMPTLWPASLDADARLDVVFADGCEFVRASPDSQYDLVVVDASDPIGPGVQLYAPAFYEALRRCLRPRGAVVAQAGSYWYLPRVFRTVYHGLKAAGFPVVMPYSCFSAVYPGGQWNLACATLGDDPRALDDENRAAAFATEHALDFYDPQAHVAAFALPPLARRELEKPRPTLADAAKDLEEIYAPSSSSPAVDIQFCGA
ncbi:hypothetical protein CTAYLR_006824 [Chrysophaeum taylorii]|uniref:Spermidine synthase n=1 Tax=Chrysophaeum taylorii TaxID=2483200 RepID=A0AAD7XHL7_9STRA|nr:hypothetical protein CTAYLR_006824 [Chrysophaeum taylorii]